MRTYLTALMLIATLGLVSCGGGNDVASSGTSAVSAAAPSTATTPSTSEPKISGQIDERTGVAPVAAQMTIWTVYSNGGCGYRSNYYGLGEVQLNACNNAINNATDTKNFSQCIALGGLWDDFGICFGGLNDKGGAKRGY